MSRDNPERVAQMCQLPGGQKVGGMTALGVAAAGIVATGCGCAGMRMHMQLASDFGQS